MSTRILVAALLLLAAWPATAESWQGEERLEAGVPQVLNPETPAETVRIELEELWERGGEDDDMFFGRLGNLVEDDEGTLYVLDSQLSEIHVFSQGGELLRTIGREGEGPGEFMQAFDMYLGPDGLLGLVRTFPGRIYRIGRDGSPADNFPLTEAGGFQIVHVARSNGERVLVSGALQTRDGARQLENSYLKAFDPEGNEILHLCGVETETRFGGMQFDEKVFRNFTRRWALADDGRVAVSMEFDDYAIHIHGPDGALERVIRRPEHKGLKRDGDQKRRLQELFDGITRWNPNSTFAVSKTHAAVTSMWFRENGDLWVLADRGTWARDEGVFASLDEYDRDGRYRRRIDLIGEGDPVEDGLFIMGDRVYRVTDLFSAIMAGLGGGEEDEESPDLDPLRLVAYRMLPAR